MAATQETLELGIIPQDDTEIVEDNMKKECRNTEDVCSEPTPMNTPADDPQPVEPEDIQSDSNATNSLHSEKSNISFVLIFYIFGV